MNGEWETADRAPHAKARRRRELCRRPRPHHPKGGARAQPAACVEGTRVCQREAGSACRTNQLSDLGVRGHLYGPHTPGLLELGSPHWRRPETTPQRTAGARSFTPPLPSDPRTSKELTGTPQEAVPRPLVSKACRSRRRRPCRHPQGPVDRDGRQFSEEWRQWNLWAHSPGATQETRLPPW